MISLLFCARKEQSRASRQQLNESAAEKSEGQR